MNMYIEKGSSTGTGELGTAPMEKVLHLICFVKYQCEG